MVVVHVGRVLVRVRDLSVHVTVRVLTDEWRVVFVVVMTIVMTVRVLVLGGLVHVRMPVLLGRMQIDTNTEADGGNRGKDCRVAVAENPRDASSDERREREHGSGTRCTDAALREQIEAQAETVTRRPAHEQNRDRRDLRRDFGTRDRYRSRERGAERAFCDDDLQRIALGERTHERVVDRPRERRDCDRGYSP